MKSKLSIFTLIGLFAWISVYRLTNVNKAEISWDVLGYYIYLPSTFIYHQPMLNNDDWLQKVNDEKHLSGTLYQVTADDKGHTMYFFLMGTAMFYLPFFLISHLLAHMLGFPADGFSMPYQYGLVVGCILYTFLALFFLRKILRHFFNEVITSLVLFLVVIGTNYCHYATLGNLTQPTMLVLLVTIILWNTLKWHEDHMGKRVIIIGASITMMALVKPTEACIVVLPLLWGVESVQGFKDKLKLLLSDKKTILQCLLVCFLLVLPQMLYWFIKTGKPIYNSYRNPGIGLDFFTPHIYNILFSFRKGWMIYTPLMFFSLWGFREVYKTNKPIFWGMMGYFCLTFYLISCWTEWWYGGSYSCRPIVTAYPVLSISFGYFLQYLSRQRIVFKALFTIVAAFFVFLNQFQWWQLNHWLLDPYRMTAKYYWAIFLKTHRTMESCDYMLFERKFSGHQVLEDKDTAKYIRKQLALWTFDTLKDPNVRKDSTGNYFYHVNNDQEYTSVSCRKKVSDFTDKYYFWVKASIDVRYPKNFDNNWPSLVMTMQHKGDNYCYYAPQMPDSLKDGKWHHYSWFYLSPELRTYSDDFFCYVWKHGQTGFDFDNLKLEVYTPKE